MSGFPVSAPGSVPPSSPASRPGGFHPSPTEMLDRSGHFLFRPSEITDTDSPVEWLWDGYLARKQLTLLTGQWKIGKTTLLSALFARLGRGGELAGQRVRPGRVIVFTEENRGLWRRRIARHQLGDWVSFDFEPFAYRPTPQEFQALLDDLVRLHYQRAVDLVVIDSLASVLPGNQETNSAAMLDLLRTLREVAGTGPAMLLAHHPRKGASASGHAARGTGALSAGVDCLMELHWSGSPDRENRRRRLQAWSRWEEAPRRVLLELSECGTDYRLLPDEPDVAGTGAWPILEGLLRSAPNLTIQEIYERWPAGMERPGFRTLSVWLRELSDTRRLERSGHGHRYAPFRYRVVDEGPAAAGEPAASAAG
jgi:hypothetical protein